MKNILLILVFTFFSNIFCCEGQIKTTKIRLEIEEIVNKIAENNILQGEAVGSAGMRPEQWERYEKLKKEATNEELQLLVTHKNAVVRCYSFDALVYRKGIDIFPIILKNSSDTTRVDTFYGCFMGSKTVGRHFMRAVRPYKMDNKVYKLTKEQKVIIDSLLFVNEKKKK